MELETYNRATELLNRYRLCERILEYLTDTDTQVGQIYTGHLKSFFNEYHDELMVFVNNLMTKAGMDFENLHCECHPADDENSTEQENPA